MPVYDYVLMTEPLTPAQRASIGWAGREGMSDAGNQFHYFRLSADDRILWGGYDAIYHPGNRVGPAYDRAAGDVRAARAPVRRDVPAARRAPLHPRWGGAIDTTTRFTVTFGETLGGRVHYALGYTGPRRRLEPLGGGHPARPAAPAGLARCSDLELVRSRAVPDPARAHPDAGGGADAPRGSIGADEHEGRRGWFLRAMDALGIGFDS